MSENRGIHGPTNWEGASPSPSPGPTSFGGGSPASVPGPTQFGSGDEITGPRSEANCAGTVIDGRYIVERAIEREGGQAQVLLSRDQMQGGDYVVVKLYHGRGEPKRHILDRLKGLRHPDLVTFLDYGVWEHDVFGGFYEVQEYCIGGNLQGRKFSEQELTDVIIPQVVAGLKFCHDHGIAHRDIKESNLYYRDADVSDVVIGDLGVACDLNTIDTDEGTRLTRTFGFTYEYLAPEAYPLKDSTEYLVSASLDYYALGITLIYLLGADPLPGELKWNIGKQHDVKRLGQVRPPENISDRFAMLLKGLLHPTPRSQAPGNDWKGRWGYPEVQSWISGEHVHVGDVTPAASPPAMRTYKIDGIVPQSIPELARLLLSNPKVAHSDIHHGTLARALEQFDVDVARRVRAIEEADTSIENRFLEIVYALDPTIPYRLAPGAEAKTPHELADLIDRDAASWERGAEQLFDGSIPAWLAGIEESRRVAEWSARKDMFRSDKNAALEAFLEILNPDINPPQLELVPDQIEVCCNEERPERTVSISVRNAGRGHLHGSVSVREGEPGLDLMTTRINANRVLGLASTIELRVNMTGLDRGRVYRADVTLDTNVGEVKIPIRYRNTFPVWAFARASFAWAVIGAVAAFCLRGWLHMTGKPGWLTNYYGHYIDFAEAKRAIVFNRLEFAVPLLPLLVAVFFVIRRLRRR